MKNYSNKIFIIIFFYSVMVSIFSQEITEPKVVEPTAKEEASNPLDDKKKIEKPVSKNEIKNREFSKFEQDKIARLNQGKSEVHKPRIKNNNGWVIRYFIGTLIVAGMLGGFLFLMQKYRSSLNLPGMKGPINIVSRQTIDFKNSLLIVKVDGEKLLLGSSINGLTLLKTLDKEEEEEEDNGDKIGEDNNEA